MSTSHWYEPTKEKALDYSKPIIAENSATQYLLVPRLATSGSYSIGSYDWLNIETGRFNSCVHFPTAEAAVRSYRTTYDIYNATLEVRADAN